MRWKLSLTASLASIALSSASIAQFTQRVSVNSAGEPGNGWCEIGNVTPDGRFVVFAGTADNLSPGDLCCGSKIFLRDRRDGITERVNLNSAGTAGWGHSYDPRCTPDARFVVFTSSGSNLAAGDTNGVYDVFVRDRVAGTTERVSLGPAGQEFNQPSRHGRITPDGRFVLFSTRATNFGPNPPNDLAYLRDRATGQTEVVSLGQGGVAPNLGIQFVSVSDDGRFVAFGSSADNLVSGDTNGAFDVFVRDRLSGTTERVNLAWNGAQADEAPLLNLGCEISGNGRFVAFAQKAGNLVPGDTNARYDVFVRDRLMATTERVSVDSTGVQGNRDSWVPSISSDGRYVSFMSYSDNLVPGDSNQDMDVFLHDRRLDTTERISVSWDPAGPHLLNWTLGAIVSANGRYVIWNATAFDIVPGVTDTALHVFLRDRLGGPDFTSSCSGGTGGVAACPCSNPPNGADRGCDNSSGTGGAVLSASGGTFVSSDSLVFTTSGEPPGALSVVTQWSDPQAAGAVLGMGLRCASGTIRRLYTKTAVAGGITAPEFLLGEPQVSARSEALGDPILPGRSRWYLVSYRDNVVIGGCPLSSNFNSTQTGQVTWSP